LSSAGIFSALAITDKAVIKVLTEQVIASAGLSPLLRPEVLPLQAFYELTRAFRRALDNPPEP
jgi:hypothetical protein